MASAKLTNGMINSCLNSLSLVSSSVTPVRVNAPPDEKGDMPTNDPDIVIIENRVVGASPVAFATPSTIGYNVGITTPSVLAKKLIVPATNESMIGAEAVDVLVLNQCANKSMEPASTATEINMLMPLISIIVFQGTCFSASFSEPTLKNIAKSAANIETKEISNFAFNKAKIVEWGIKLASVEGIITNPIAPNIRINVIFCFEVKGSGFFISVLATLYPLKKMYAAINKIVSARNVFQKTLEVYCSARAA